MKIGKAPLLSLITAGYRCGIGPGPLAALTGYNVNTIGKYAASLGLTGVAVSRGKSMLPDPLPVEFLIAVAKAGLRWDDSRTKRAL